MRILVLQADSVLPEYQPRFGDYPEMFFEFMSPLDAEIASVDVRAGCPEAGAADGYVITGSKSSVYEDLEWIPPLVDFLRAELERGAKVVGICFGHQLMAHFFGGEVRAAEVGWGVGVREAQVIARQPWMTSPPASFNLLCSHKDQVTRLPDGGEVFASSDFCPISGFVVGDQVLALQGHPEFTKPYSEALMRHRQAILGAETFDEGIASLARPTDSPLVVEWLAAFFGVSLRRADLASAT